MLNGLTNHVRLAKAELVFDRVSFRMSRDNKIPVAISEKKIGSFISSAKAIAGPEKLTRLIIGGCLIGNIVQIQKNGVRINSIPKYTPNGDQHGIAPVLRLLKMAAAPRIQFEKSLIDAVLENPSGVLRIMRILTGMSSAANTRHLVMISVIISHFESNTWVLVSDKTIIKAVDTNYLKCSVVSDDS
jgi:hypothetical protein